MAGRADTVSKLKDDIDKIPLIDNHAHNLMKSYESFPAFPREMIVSLADGETLSDSIHSLAHIRMLRHLSRFLGLPIDSSLQTVIDTTKARDYTSLCRDLIRAAGIQAILIDNGIQSNFCHAISWHDQLTPSANKRIVRIELLFESIVAQSGRAEAFLYFPAAIRKLVNDPEVAGFKSNSAYQGGCDVQPLDPEQLSLKCEDAHREVHDYPSSQFEVESNNVVTWLVNVTCSTISGKGKPLQFHAGFCDNGVTLTQPDASLLYPLIKAYPNVPFVLLFSGYPRTRQVGYIARMYHNVYLDFGLAIPPLSGDGQRNLIRQLLEICPTNKLLWSSSTVFYPERFYLAALQTREALAEILDDYVQRDEIGFDEAIQVAKRMLFENANKLYRLNIDYVELGLERTTETKDDANEKKNDEETRDEANTHGAMPPALSNLPEPVKPKIPISEVSEPIRVSGTSSETTSTLVKHLKSRGIKFVRIAWVDYVNFTRYQAVSIERFAALVGSQLFLPQPSYPSEQLVESGISIPQSALGMQIDDTITAGVSSLGYYDLKPDFSTMWTPPFAKGYAHMMGRFFHRANLGEKELETCPRTILQRVIWQVEQELDVTFLVNFKTVFLLIQNSAPLYSRTASFSKLCNGPATDCMHEIVQNVVDAGIKLSTYDTKGEDGYLLFEIVTGPLSPMQAADALAATREIIHCTAQKHNLRATLVHKLWIPQDNTYSQVHISVQSASSDIPSNHSDIPSLPKDLASFMAGLLAHLDSVCMFTLPLDACYPRVANDPLKASVWACWSTENTDTPIRLCGSEQEGFNVEVRTFDGAANPFLGLAAILGAGLIGLRGQDELDMRDYCNVASQRKHIPAEDSMRELGITMKMPTSNKVFSNGPDEMTEFFNTWLPDEAWKLYKDVRKHEKNIFYSVYGPHSYGKQHY